MFENHIPTQRALLVWLRPVKEGRCRSRHAVAELAQKSDGVAFRYFSDERMAAAREEGFRGYPGLPLGSSDLNRTALDVLMMRLPPRNRRAYKELLKCYGLAADGEYSDLSLLACTGARLTSDGFSVCETFDGFDAPFSYVFDVAGYRHCARDAELKEGERMIFKREPDNEMDRNAVRVAREDDVTVGYVNRLQAAVVGGWLDAGEISASVLHSNGRLEYPRLFVKAKVIPHVGAIAA